MPTSDSRLLACKEHFWLSTFKTVVSLAGCLLVASTSGRSWLGTVLSVCCVWICWRCHLFPITRHASLNGRRCTRDLVPRSARVFPLLIETLPFYSTMLVMSLVNVRSKGLNFGRLMLSKGTNILLNQDHILDKPQFSGDVVLMWQQGFAIVMPI
jgi:hypothetical protein